MFAPWIGERWGHPDNELGGFRILVLGESHYADHPEEIGTENPGLTRWVIERYLSRKLTSGFFTRISGLLAGRTGAEMTTEQRQALWSSIVFYNYVPVIVGTGPKQRPADWMWARGKEPFLDVMRRSEAEAILVLGSELWNHMPAVGEANCTTFELRGETRWARWYKPDRPGMISPYRVVAAAINHPSSTRWSAGQWSPVLDFVREQVIVERQRLEGYLASAEYQTTVS